MPKTYEQLQDEHKEVRATTTALLLNLRVKSHDKFETYDCTLDDLHNFLSATGEVFEHRPFIAPQSSNPATVYRQNRIHYETV